MSVTEVSVKFIWTQTFGRIFTEVGTWSESKDGKGLWRVGGGKQIGRKNWE